MKQFLNYNCTHLIMCLKIESMSEIIFPLLTGRIVLSIKKRNLIKYYSSFFKVVFFRLCVISREARIRLPYIYISSGISSQQISGKNSESK